MKVRQGSKSNVSVDVLFPPGSVVDVPTLVADQLLARREFSVAEDDAEVVDVATEGDAHAAEIAAHVAAADALRARQAEAALSEAERRSAASRALREAEHARAEAALAAETGADAEPDVEPEITRGRGRRGRAAEPESATADEVTTTDAADGDAE